jgi:hypothetical protein
MKKNILALVGAQIAAVSCLALAHAVAVPVPGKGSYFEREKISASYDCESKKVTTYHYDEEGRLDSVSIRRMTDEEYNKYCKITSAAEPLGI